MEIVDMLDMLESMAEHGHAPQEGCSLFGVGYENAFQRLKEAYLERRFKRGGSAEKFVIGPFGSGKTHFIRQLMEIARNMGCVTSEVPLNKYLDFTQNLLLYRVVAREIRVPGQTGHGIPSLLRVCLENVRRKAPHETISEKLLLGWVSGLEQVDFKLEAFGRILRLGLTASLQGNDETFTAACHWLAGEVSDRFVSRQLSLAPVPKNEQNLHGRRALLSLFQFIRHSGFPGTVVCYDEAEQGLTVDKRKTERILSMLQSGINALADLQMGSVLVVYAITPDLREKMANFAALQQRVADPGVDESFFDGNTMAPVIDLTRRKDPLNDLQSIGHRLVGLFYEQAGSSMTVGKEIVIEKVNQFAEEIAGADQTTSNRREMVRRTCAMLVRLYSEGVVRDVAVSGQSTDDEDEV